MVTTIIVWLQEPGNANSRLSTDRVLWYTGVARFLSPGGGDLSQLTLFPTEPRLSKSKFLSGLQCHKRLYLEIHAPELATEPDEQTQAILDNGTELGELARRLFPNGVLVDFGRTGLEKALTLTDELILDPTVPAIFEATFKFDNVLVRVDILERLSLEEWRLIEVKASTKVKAVHLEDLAIQTYVLRGCNLRLSGVRLMHLNRGYIYPGGPIDLHQLFVQQDLTEDMTDRLPAVPTRLADMKHMLVHWAPPEIKPGNQCHDPYACEFWEHCTQQKPERWIFHLSGPKSTFKKLIEQGIETIDDIPEDFPLSVVQQRMKDNTEWIGPLLKASMQSLRYPVHHLDFETFMPAVPRYPGTRAYQALPFQWSNHIEFEDGSLRHEQYLCTEQRDPREEFAMALLQSVGRAGSICVYSDYEKLLLMDLADALPRLRREIYAVISRLWDLLGVIQRHYYHPDFKGSFSLKSVLPALVPSLDYGDLEIRDGALASLLYHRMVSGSAADTEKDRLITALLEYCKRDTLGMLEVRRALSWKASTLQPTAP
jgi:Domain of unknown function(DUF2779)